MNRGSDLLEREDGTTNDGIVILHNLYERYKYDGDVQTYKSNLMNMMNKKSKASNRKAVSKPSVMTYNMGGMVKSQVDNLKKKNA